jgi:hypothetical protein
LFEATGGNTTFARKAFLLTEFERSCVHGLSGRIVRDCRESVIDYGTWMGENLLQV